MDLAFWSPVAGDLTRCTLTWRGLVGHLGLARAGRPPPAGTWPFSMLDAGSNVDDKRHILFIYMLSYMRNLVHFKGKNALAARCSRHWKRCCHLRPSGGMLLAAGLLPPRTVPPMGETACACPCWSGSFVRPDHQHGRHDAALNGRGSDAESAGTWLIVAG